MHANSVITGGGMHAHHILSVCGVIFFIYLSGPIVETNPETHICLEPATTHEL